MQWNPDLGPIPKESERVGVSRKQDILSSESVDYTIPWFCR
jgi:hypothetical protein